MFTETVTVAGPCPDGGDADSQFPPLVVETVILQIPGGEPPTTLVTCVVCARGFAPPGCAWNVKLEGEKSTEAWPAAAIHNRTARVPMTIPARRLRIVLYSCCDAARLRFIFAANTPPVSSAGVTQE